MKDRVNNFRKKFAVLQSRSWTSKYSKARKSFDSRLYSSKVEFIGVNLELLLELDQARDGNSLILKLLSEKFQTKIRRPLMT